MNILPIASAILRYTSKGMEKRSHTNASNVTNDLLEETRTESSNKSKGDLTKIIEICDILRFLVSP